MGLQVLFGVDNQEKKRWLIHKIDQMIQENPESKIYYIVPEHMKFEMENFVLETLQEMHEQPSMAMMNIQVVSFSRLAWYLLPHKIDRDQCISDIGMNMILHQLMKENKESLHVLRKHIHHHGFIEKLQSLFQEFYQGQIDLPALDVFIEQLSGNAMEQQKVSEIRYLYGKFMDKVAETPLMNYELFQEIREVILDDPTMNHVSFVIDHYVYFSNLQYGIIDAILKKAKQLWVTLPYDRIPKISEEGQGMFATSQNTYWLLIALAEENKVTIDNPQYIEEVEDDYSKDLRRASHLMKSILDYQAESLPVQTHTSESHELWQCDSVQTELIRVSNQIYHLVHEKGYRYKDIIIMTRDLELYADLIPEYLSMNYIPYFIDHTRTMMSHSFSKWLDALFKLHLYHWKYQDIMNVLKIGLIIPDYMPSKAEYFHQLSILENFILAHGYDRYRFYDLSFEWDRKDASMEYMNHLGDKSDISEYDVLSQLREWVVEKYYHPFTNLTTTFTGKFAADWLYQTVIQMGVMDSLIQQRDRYINEGDIHQSKHIEQIWQVFVQILDEFYTIYANHSIHFEDFTYFILSGFKGASFHIIPPTLDQVTVTNIESPQVQSYHVLFVLNLSYGSLPKYQQNDSLLSDELRSEFQSHLLPYQSMVSSQNQNNHMEALIAYQLFNLPKSYMYITYIPDKNTANDNLSPYIKQWLQYQKIPVYSFTNKQFFSMHHPSNIGSHKSLYPMYIYELGQQILQEIPINHHMKMLGKAIFASGSEDFKEDFIQIFQQMFSHIHLPETIQSEVAIQLFGHNLVSSVSRMEMYYQDPYSYFLIYGLRLKEREELSLNPLTTGNMVHDILDETVKAMIEQELSWKEIEEPQLMIFQEKALKKMLDQPTMKILMSDSRQYFVVQHLIHQLKNYIHHYLIAARDQLLKPVKTELIFGQKSDAEIVGKEFILGDQRKLSITGKIDRIDQTFDQNMIQIVDYKSGNKKFDLVKMFYGLDLQIMTYYLLAKEAYNTDKAIGGFYHSLKSEIKEGTQNDWQLIRNQENTNYFVGQKFSGFMTLDSKDMSFVQDNIQESYRTSIYPIRIKKDGSYYNNTVYFDSQAMEKIEAYIYHLYKKAGQAIQSGYIKLQPFKEDDFVISKNRQYRVITGFDAKDHYHVYRKMEVKSKDVLEQISLVLKERELDESK